MANCTTADLPVNPWTLPEAPDKTVSCQFRGIETRLYIDRCDRNSRLIDLCDLESKRVCWATITPDLESTINETETSCGDVRTFIKDTMTIPFTTICPPSLKGGEEDIMALYAGARRDNAKLRVALVLPSGNTFVGFADATELSLDGFGTEDLETWGGEVTIDRPLWVPAGVQLPTMVAIRPTAAQDGGDIVSVGDIVITAAGQAIQNQGQFFFDQTSIAAGQAQVLANVDGVVPSFDTLAPSALFDGDTSTPYEFASIASGGYAGLSTCFALPQVTSIEICPDDANIGQSIAAGEVIISSDQGKTWAVIGSFNIPQDFVAGSCQTVLLDCYDATSGVGFTYCPAS